ncbi:translocating chain-associated membrane protein 1 isoform X2 [Hyalella azteca]|uniref:Translocating chain-associated membrane protein n=1 Tax=Hyalella azteca TaxID=294128 RepID=A0A8B7P5W8_HYAAZ|nr:translocating chain-associated membrane protein 1 isoform X2 [Hyalella azteca]
MVIKPPRKNKNPPFLSNEFIIQNHGDIVSCVAMVFVLGLMFQATSPIASVFIILQHAITTAESDQKKADYVVQYTNGALDWAAIFFYSLIAIVVHVILQEYALDKANRKLHLSKTRNSKFNEYGQLLLFALFSVAWGLHILFRDDSFTGLSSLWANYPEDHTKLSFRLKFYFIIQIAYWLHTFPELYFQKVKREEMPARITYACIHLVYITAAYLLSLTRLGLVLLVLHYLSEGTLHASRLLHFAELTKQSQQGFKTYNIMFVGLRLVSLIIAIITLVFGFGSLPAQGIDIATGNFNSAIVRYACLVAVCALQAYMMWNFLTFHLRKRRERRAEIAAAQKKKQQLAKAAKKAAKKGSDDEVALLPEVDQNTRRRR